MWAIGTGKTATAEDVEEMRIYIHKVLAEIFGRNAAIKVRIIYGGSVKPDNARKLYIEGGVNGFLVGGASLKTDSFTSIINSTK
ncbi:triose-phosphate isomerase [Candidatus Kaiserbacteria bacterium]|nr:triose-phosphate isomerase [Candidatus Kaiserbacteria bacterium]